MPVARVHRDIPPPRPVMPPPQHAEPPSHVPTPLHGRSESISIPEFSSRLPNRSSSQRSGKSLLGRFFRNAFHSARDTPTDPNVRINLNAPDAGDIIDDRPQRVTATPLPISAPGHMRAASPMMHMPEVDHNPDPRNVPPIVDSTTPRTPAHRHVAIPPEGYIPQLDENGGIGLPPPHELEKPPPTPGLGMDAAALPIGMGEVIFYQEMKRRLRSLAKGKRRAFLAANSVTSEDVVMEDAASSIEQSAVGPSQSDDSITKGLESLLAPDQVSSIKTALGSLEMEQAVDELLRRNTKALQRLEELQLQRLRAQGGGSSVVEVGSEEWDVGEFLIASSVASDIAF